MAAPTPQEQYFIELVNRARANPQQFAIDFNVGVSLSEATPQPPLAVNALLTDSARGHAVEMATNNYFDHQSAVTGKWPNQMARDAGYPLPNWWKNPDGSDPHNYIESISAGFPGFESAVKPVVSLLFDGGAVGANAGHRVHLLAIDNFNQQYQEVGVGYGFNDAAEYKNYWALQTGYDENATGRFLTGVTYNDTVVANGFYEPGEQLGGATITATRTSDNAVFTTTSFSSGGYSLRLQPGTYNVTASGPGFSTPVTISNVVMTATANVKKDFKPSAVVVAPTVTAFSFARNTSPQRANITFSTNVQASLSGSDFTLTNLTAGGTVAVNAGVTYNTTTNTATIDFANAQLPDAKYRLTVLAAGVTTAGGTPMASNATFDFTMLRGDANNDGTINFADLLVLAANYGQTGKNMDTGDTNFDGTVNFTDLLALASKYGTSLATTADTAASAGTVTPVETTTVSATVSTTAPLDDDDVLQQSKADVLA